MNQQRIERMIASAFARQISGLVSQERQDALITADQKVRDAQVELREVLDSTVRECLGNVGRPAHYKRPSAKNNSIADESERLAGNF